MSEHLSNGFHVCRTSNQRASFRCPFCHRTMKLRKDGRFPTHRENRAGRSVRRLPECVGARCYP